MSELRSAACVPYLFPLPLLHACKGPTMLFLCVNVACLDEMKKRSHGFTVVLSGPPLRTVIYIAL